MVRSKKRSRRSKKKLVGGSNYKTVKNIRGECSNYKTMPGSENFKSKCVCTQSNRSFQFNTRLFDCNESDGLVLKPLVSGAKLSEFHRRMKEIDETSSKNNGTADRELNELFSNFSELSLDTDVKSFIREYIKDQYKTKKKDVSLKNVEDLISILDAIKEPLIEKLKASNRKFTMEDFKAVLENVKKSVEDKLRDVKNLQLTRNELKKPEWWKRAKEIADNKEPLPNKNDKVVATIILIKKEIKRLLALDVYKPLYKNGSIDETMRDIIDFHLEKESKSETGHYEFIKRYYDRIVKYIERRLISYYSAQKSTDARQKIIEYVNNWIKKNADDKGKQKYDDYISYSTNRRKLIEQLASKDYYDFSVETFYKNCIQAEQCEGIGAKISSKFISANIEELLTSLKSKFHSEDLDKFRREIRYLDQPELEDIYVKLQNDPESTILDILSKELSASKFKNLQYNRRTNRNSRNSRNNRRGNMNSRSSKDDFKLQITHLLRVDPTKYSMLLLKNSEEFTVEYLKKALDKEVARYTNFREFVKTLDEPQAAFFVNQKLLHHQAAQYQKTKDTSDKVKRSENITKFIEKFLDEDEDKTMLDNFKIYIKLDKQNKFKKELILYLNNNEGNIYEFLTLFETGRWPIYNFVESIKADILVEIQRKFNDTIKKRDQDYKDSLNDYLIKIATKDNAELEDIFQEINRLDEDGLKMKLDQ